MTEEQIGQYRVGMVVEAYGEILFHKNATQLRVRKLIVDEEANLLDYVREAPMEKEAMEQEIDTIIANMKDSVIQEVVKKVLESVKERFYLYPAATRNHHNFVGGLAYHTICMARMAKPVVEQYPFLDEDLVLAGILLHDVGDRKSVV